MVYGEEKIDPYLYGRKITVNRPPVSVQDIWSKNEVPAISDKKLHSWSLRLMMYSSYIEYRRRSEFGNDDASSRL